MTLERQDFAQSFQSVLGCRPGDIKKDIFHCLPQYGKGTIDMIPLIEDSEKWRRASQQADAASLSASVLLMETADDVPAFKRLPDAWASFLVGAPGYYYRNKKSGEVWRGLGTAKHGSCLLGPFDATVREVDGVEHSYFMMDDVTLKSLRVKWAWVFHVQDPGSSTHDHDWVGIPVKQRLPAELVHIGLHDQGLVDEIVGADQDLLTFHLLEGISTAKHVVISTQEHIFF